MPAHTSTRFHVRWMIRRDLPEILAIEREASAFPWDGEKFLASLRHRNVVGMVAEVGPYDSPTDLGTVVRYMIYGVHKCHLSLLRFGVREDWWGRGVRKALVEKLKSKLTDRRTRLRASVRDDDLDLQLFFRGQRFLATAVRRGACEEDGSDAYLFEYLVPGDDVIGGED